MERVSEYDSAQFLCEVLGGGILEEGFQTRLDNPGGVQLQLHSENTGTGRTLSFLYWQKKL